MESQKIIAVVGATGAQGGSLVNAILNDRKSNFKVRAITRNANSEKSMELKRKGAEVVEADLDDQQSLVKAFEGAYGAFCVTFFWEHFSPEKEKQQAKNMAEAAKEAGIKHVIWSTLEDTRKWIPLDDDRMPTLMNYYKVPHLDAKGESNKYFEDSGVPYTLLHTSFYWDNFINFGMAPQKGADGELYLTFPMADKKLPGIAAEDIGKSAYGIFKAGDKYMNKSVGIAGEHLTGDQMATTFSEVYGKKIRYNAVEPAVYRTFDFPGADDLGNMFQFKADFEGEYCKARDVENTRKLDPELLSFKQWLQNNREKMKV
ncbi:NmrA/HSCARG family protein [Salinimicrobium sp. TH3]|uniref:NmrA/HSCARG family protein n=1 Tax=Salinimicrobium sp. TH3 TaxID=2997342 RepID=UPI002275FE89|nr:NmrA/HSCARG family protein [Salinimicrobium sp. TH3]MCY2688617.1 NmrA/HSCARG family protein [Salinimicrobium sp. TH3]